MNSIGPFIRAIPHLFGVPDPLPVIQGFTIKAEEGSWLLAQQGPKSFLVEVKRFGHRLYPYVGNECRTDQAINIPL